MPSGVDSSISLRFELYVGRAAGFEPELVKGTLTPKTIFQIIILADALGLQNAAATVFKKFLIVRLKDTIFLYFYSIYILNHEVPVPVRIYFSMHTRTMEIISAIGLLFYSCPWNPEKAIQADCKEIPQLYKINQSGNFRLYSMLKRLAHEQFTIQGKLAKLSL
jgi:hypothetical protein